MGFLIAVYKLNPFAPHFDREGFTVRNGVAALIDKNRVDQGLKMDI